jgi:FkbM family methyltransferase
MAEGVYQSRTTQRIGPGPGALVRGYRRVTARLYLSDNDCSASIVAGFRPPRGQVEVPMTTLDRFAAEWGLEGVDLVKIDVEGAEHKVRRGAEQVLRRHRPVIVCEVVAGREVGKTGNVL